MQLCEKAHLGIPFSGKAVHDLYNLNEEIIESGIADFLLFDVYYCLRIFSLFRLSLKTIKQWHLYLKPLKRIYFLLIWMTMKEGKSTLLFHCHCSVCLNFSSIK